MDEEMSKEVSGRKMHMERKKKGEAFNYGNGRWG